MPDDPDLRRLLWLLLGGTRGGENRARIIRELKERPGNLNQIATRLGMEYRLVKHHVDVLMKNSIVISKGERYGQMYFLNPWFESRLGMFEEVASKLGFGQGKP